MKRKILYTSIALTALTVVMMPKDSQAMFPAFDGTLFGARVEQAIVMIKEGYEFYEQGKTLVEQSITMGNYIKEGDWGSAFGTLGKSLNSVAGMGVNVINVKNAINNTQSKIATAQSYINDPSKLKSDAIGAGATYANMGISAGMSAIESSVAKKKENMLGAEDETQAEKTQRLAEIDQEYTDSLTESLTYAQTAQQTASESPQKTANLSQQVSGSTDMATDLQNEAEIGIYQAEVANSGNELQARMLKMMSIQAARSRAQES
jgi:hypothetical protein